MVRRPCALVVLFALAAPSEASFINYASKEVNIKVVYYGCPAARVLDNLQHIYDKTDPALKGKLISLATENERTVFFDFLPREMREIHGFKLRYHLYAIPGASTKAMRKLVLKGVDAVVFVADTDPAQAAANTASWNELLALLKEHGNDPAQMPIAVQLDSHDHPRAQSGSELTKALRLSSQPTFPAVARQGVGVFETFYGVARLVRRELERAAE